MTDAEILGNGGVHLGGDSLRPARGVEEVTAAQEVDEDGELGGSSSICVAVVLRQARDVKLSLGSALQLASAVVDLLLNVLALGDLVKVLHTDLASVTGAVFAVVRPILAINAITSAIPARLCHFVIQCEPAHDNDAAPSSAKRRDHRLGPPAFRPLVDVAAAEVAAEMLVGSAAGALALEAHEDGLAGVGVQEAVDVVQHVGEVLCAGERDGEDGVDQREGVVVGVDGHADVEEAHAVLELLCDADGLAADGGEGRVAGG